MGLHNLKYVEDIEMRIFMFMGSNPKFSSWKEYSIQILFAKTSVCSDIFISLSECSLYLAYSLCLV